MNTTLAVLFVLFVSVVYGVYLILPKKARPWCLLVFSLLFYVVYSKFMTVFLLLTIFSVWFAGITINKFNDKFARLKEGLDKDERKKLKQRFNKKKYTLVVCTVLFNLAILAVLKYFNFFSSVFEGFLSWFNVNAHMPVLKVVLPLGISYYTLTAIGYVVDVNRGKYRAGNLFQVALFLSFFPQMYEGPFARYDQLSCQLQAGEGFKSENFFGGILTILWGLVKKIVIADRLAIVVCEVFSNYANYNGIIVVLGILFFTFQLYAEFSGLIDVARGISEMFGIKLSENFRQPFFSQNVNEFWRRWHISLGQWFKDYIFYPVSMSKGITALNKKLQGKVNNFFQVFIPSSIAMLAVWLSTGIWHGAGAKYIVYGLYYFVLMLIGMCLEPLANWFFAKTKTDKNNKVYTALRIARTFVLVNIGMLIFRACSLHVAVDMFAQIFSSGSFNLIKLNIIDVHDFVMCFVGIAALLVVDAIQEKKMDLKTWFVKHRALTKMAIIIVLIFVILVFGAYGNGYVPADPIYGAF